MSACMEVVIKLRKWVTKREKKPKKPKHLLALAELHEGASL